MKYLLSRIQYKSINNCAQNTTYYLGKYKTTKSPYNVSEVGYACTKEEEIAEKCKFHK
jgi:hypothetical protein